jgi:16S rRNA (adenine1518-N6/adenine1519-N6)-dimethyltransferase
LLREKWILNLNSNLWFDKLILLFQKEVADRIIGNFNTASYGRLSIISNWRLNIKKIIDIKPSSFKPKPKVDSTLLLFTPKISFFKLKHSESIENVTRIFFNQKRKKIKKPLNKLFSNSDQIIKKLNLNLDLRPQNLDYQTYYMLAKELEDLRS